MNIPNEASISFFDCGEHTIKVIASFTSGKEYVFVDDQLVSEKRSFRFKSEHTFVLDGQQAIIKVSIASLFRGSYLIEFWLEQQLIDSDEWDMKRIMQHVKQAKADIPRWKRVASFIIVVTVCGAFGAFVGFSLATFLKG